MAFELFRGNRMDEIPQDEFSSLLDTDPDLHKAVEALEE